MLSKIFQQHKEIYAAVFLCLLGGRGAAYVPEELCGVYEKKYMIEKDEIVKLSYTKRAILAWFIAESGKTGIKSGDNIKIINMGIYGRKNLQIENMR